MCRAVVGGPKNIVMEPIRVTNRYGYWEVLMDCPVCKERKRMGLFDGGEQDALLYAKAKLKQLNSRSVRRGND